MSVYFDREVRDMSKKPRPPFHQKHQKKKTALWEFGGELDVIFHSRSLCLTQKATHHQHLICAVLPVCLQWTFLGHVHDEC
jgi:hypothetical protein